MMRSSSPIRNHAGTSFHSGRSPDGSTSAAWVAGIMFELTGGTVGAVTASDAFPLVVLVMTRLLVNEMLFSSLSTWGWIILVFGIIQLLAGYLVFARNDAGNLLGVAAAVIAAVIWFFFLFASPFGAFL